MAILQNHYSLAVRASQFPFVRRFSKAAAGKNTRSHGKHRGSAFILKQCPVPALTVQIAGIPAGGNGQFQRVILFDQAGHIPCLILDPFGIARPSRREPVPGDGLSVDSIVIDPQAEAYSRARILSMTLLPWPGSAHPPQSRAGSVRPCSGVYAGSSPSWPRSWGCPAWDPARSEAPQGLLHLP